MSDTVITGAPDLFYEALQPTSSKGAFHSLEVAAVVGDDQCTSDNDEFRALADYVSVSAPGLYLTADEADRAAQTLQRAAAALRAATGGAA